jgi:threonine dehydrogenase-like Zn-dependent dehydrogenase
MPNLRGRCNSFTITASDQGAEVVDFNKESPVEVIRELTKGIGVDRAIDAVGVDASHAKRGPAHKKSEDKEFKKEVREIVPNPWPDGKNWQPGDAPSQPFEWAVETLAKAGTPSIVGVYPGAMKTFPVGDAMEKNLTVRMGNCNHRKYAPQLVRMVREGSVEPTQILTQVEPLTSAIEAYKVFDLRQPGWIKVELQPQKAISRGV